MKRFFTLLAIVILTSCSIGLQFASSHEARQGKGHGGKQETATISFVYKEKTRVQVQIDNKTYNVETTKAGNNKVSSKHGKGGHGDEKGIKASSRNTITLPAGTHKVRVSAKGREIYHGTVTLRPSEHKEIRI